MPRTITIRAGDTETLDITVGAAGLADLNAVTAAELYVRRTNQQTNHVDGVALSIPDPNALTVRFDPVGAKAGGGDAFDETGQYHGYVRLTHADGDTTRHPAEAFLLITVEETFE